MNKRQLFYLRGEPNTKNDPTEWLPDFETEEQAAERYAARERLMFPGKSMSQPNFHWCTQDTPCDSGACPFCMRSFRRWLVDAGITLFEERGDPLSVASLVHHSLSRFPGHLNTFDLRKAKRQLARHVDRAGLGALVAIGGFDFSYNQPTAPVNSYWQPHAYVIFQGAESEIVKQALSPFYPATTNIPRPIRTRRVCDLMQALSYARPNTRGFDLKPKAERELISYLDQLKPNDRLFLENVRRLGATLIRSKV